MKFLRRQPGLPFRAREPSSICGFGALMNRESTLLWILNSGGTVGTSPEQCAIVAGIIAALQQRFELLPAPRRFDFLNNAVHRANSRGAQTGVGRGGSRHDLIRRHRALEGDLNALKAQWAQHRDWAPTLTHAAAAHAQMAYALRIQARREAR